jgi:hypothetical protein
MPDILHRVGIKSAPKKVFEALSTIDGLSHWWIVDTKGNAKQGGIIHFGFADILLFTHANWKKPVEFMYHCSTKWATFLLSLRDWLERAEGRPSPYDVKIHVGD